MVEVEGLKTFENCLSRLAKTHSKFHYYVHEKVRIQAENTSFFRKKLWHGLLINNIKTLQIIFSKFSKQAQTILIRLCEVISDFHEI